MTDPDRHLLAFIAAEMVINGLTFEHAALLSLCLDSERIELPLNPLRQARRLRLSPSTKRKLEEGWLLQSFRRLKPTQKMDSRIDTLRKKLERHTRDESARAWLHNIGNAYYWLLRDGSAAGRLILEFADAADERPYFEKLLTFMGAETTEPLIPKPLT